MSAYPYNMFSNDLPTFTSADLIAHMGLSDRTMYGPPPFTWATKAFLTRGKIAHGTSLPSGYESGLTTVDGAGVPLGRNIYWDALAPWVVVLAESDNLCTNAYVKISQIQCFILSKRTGLWTRFGTMGRGYPSIAPGKYKYDYTTGYGPSTAIYDVDGAPCYWPWHTVGPEQVILHNAIIAKGAIDGEDFGGCFVTCQSQLVAPAGEAFDATPHYALSLGADLYPDMDATISNSILAGRSYLVAVGGSALKTIPSDGSPRMHYFITSPDVGVTAKDNTSIYEVANGATSMYMSNAELAANMPVLTPNLNIVQAAAEPATAVIDISLAGGTTQSREGSATLSIDFTSGTPTEVTLTRNDNYEFAVWPDGALSQYFTEVPGGLEFALSLEHMNLDLNAVSARAIYADNQSVTDRLIITIEAVTPAVPAVVHGPQTYTPTTPTGVVKYVSTTGTGDGLTIGNPMSLTAANTSAVAGDHFWLRGGTYAIGTSGFSFTKHGTSVAYITYEAYPGETAILSGAAARVENVWQSIYLEGSYTTLRHVNVTGMARQGVEIDGVNNIVEYCEIYGNWLSGITIYSSENFTVTDTTKGSRNTVRHNTCYSNSDVGHLTGWYADGGNADGISLYTGADNIIEYNLVYSNSDDGIDIWKSERTIVRNNISRTNGLGGGDGTGIKCGGGATVATGAVISYNISIGNVGKGFSGNGGDQVTVYHNTSSGNYAGFWDYTNTDDLVGNIAAEVTRYGGGTAGHSGNSWNISVGTTPTFISTTPGSSDYYRPPSGNVFEGIGAHAA